MSIGLAKILLSNSECEWTRRIDCAAARPMTPSPMVSVVVCFAHLWVHIPYR